MEVNVILINDGIMINVTMSVKDTKYVKKFKFGIVLHVIVKMENIQQMYLWMIQKLQNNTVEKQKLF